MPLGKLCFSYAGVVFSSTTLIRLYSWESEMKALKKGKGCVSCDLIKSFFLPRNLTLLRHFMLIFQAWFLCAFKAYHVFKDDKCMVGISRIYQKNFIAFSLNSKTSKSNLFRAEKFPLSQSQKFIFHQTQTEKQWTNSQHLAYYDEIF